MSDLPSLTGMSVVLRHIDAYIEGLQANAQIAAAEIGAVLESYAKGHHPWSPKTGATDVSTKGADATGGQEYAPQDGVIDIYLSAGMDYDVFLELARSGRWAWLWPAIDANRGRIKSILLKRLGEARVATK